MWAPHALWADLPCKQPGLQTSQTPSALQVSTVKEGQVFRVETSDWTGKSHLPSTCTLLMGSHIGV